MSEGRPDAAGRDPVDEASLRVVVFLPRTGGIGETQGLPAAEQDRRGGRLARQRHASQLEVAVADLHLGGT